jgi:hypothetical protein
MSPVAWRWEEKDLGFRFRIGKGTRNAEYYQGRAQGEFYIVPAIQRKLSPDRVKELAALVATPPVPQVVANPWNDYHQDWDWVTTADGICLNWAGCLDKTEIDRREDEGVQRAMELVAGLVERDEAVAVDRPAETDPQGPDGRDLPVRWSLEDGHASQRGWADGGHSTGAFGG